MKPDDCLNSFMPAVRDWFLECVGKPSMPQRLGWPVIAEGKHTLICAPTGSGKTLAAFLKCLDHIYRSKPAGGGEACIKAVYISPLKALNNDIYRNLEVPLEGIGKKAAELGLELPEITAAVRTGDTPQKDRASMLRKPPDILITTPESLFIMLTSKKAADLFSQVEFAIVDEIHSLCPTKRGVHFSLSLERLQSLSTKRLVRIGLSATINPLEEAAGFLGGMEAAADPEGKREMRRREVCIVNCEEKRGLDLCISTPVKNYKAIPEGTVWTSMYSQILTLIKAHRSTLIFVNNRRLAELVAAGINNLAGEPLVKTHHGSISRELRQQIEQQLKRGELPCLVATSTLEMGIDIGSIELVIQVGAPDSAAQALQRIGRSGHRLEAVSKGRILPRTRGDLLKASFASSQALDFSIEKVKIPANCLDVLAQQITSIACAGDTGARELHELVKRAWPYRELPFKQLAGILEMLAYPSPEDEPDLIKPRLVYDRISGTVKGNSLGRLLCLTEGGTIPDKGNYTVCITGTEVKLGELQEEFVFESKLGDRFYLGSTAWRIDAIDHDRVWVSQSEASGAKIPFWIGDRNYRSFETGVKYGGYLSELEARTREPGFEEWARKTCGLDRTASENLQQYVLDQISATGRLHNDRLIVCEYFSDEAGDKRIIVHTPFGGGVHAVMAVLLHSRLVRLLGCIVEYVFNDEGILLHIIGASGSLKGIMALLDTVNLEDEILSGIPESPAFNMSMRYNLARSLLLPPRSKRVRKPLWIQRLRSAEIARHITRRPDHPVVAETYREVLSDLFDLKGFDTVLRDMRVGRINVHEVTTGRPSPFSAELLFNFWQVYQYVSDLPAAEKRNQLLINDRDFIRLAVGLDGEYDLIDERAVKAVSRELEKLKYGRRIAGPDELYYFIYAFGELPCEGNPFKEVPDGDLKLFLKTLEEQGRILRFDIGGTLCWIAAEDYPAYCGIRGIDRYSHSFTVGGSGEERVVRAGEWLNSYILSLELEPKEAMLRILRRYLRFRTPFTPAEIVRRYSVSAGTAVSALDDLAATSELLLLKHGDEAEGRVYCNAAVYDRIRKKTIEFARRDIKPKSKEAYCSFLFEYHGIGDEISAPEDRLIRVVEMLKGVFLPVSWWEDFVFPARVRGYEPRVLDYLCSTGRVNWIGRINGSTEEAAFFPGEKPTSSAGSDSKAMDAFEARAYETLKSAGACFIRDFSCEMGAAPEELIKGIEGLVWRGLIANDSFAVARYYMESRKKNSPWARYGAYPSMGRWYVPAFDSGDDTGDRILQYVNGLLDRYGIVCREIVNTSRDGYRWGEVYAYLKNHELISGIKRGYFVSGLSGIQYARDAEIERLRRAGEGGGEAYVTLSSCDPANPYRDLFAGEKRAYTGKNAGSAIVFKNGEPVLLVREYGSVILPLAGEEAVTGKALEAFAAAFAKKALWATRKNMLTEYWGEESIESSPFYGRLLGMGFDRGYKGITLWRKAN